MLSSNTQTHAGVFTFKTSLRGNSSLGYVKFDDQTVRLQFTHWQRLLERQAEIRARMTPARKWTAFGWAGDHCGVSCGNCGVRKWKKYSVWDWGYRWERDNNVAVLHTVARGCRWNITRAGNGVISTRLCLYSWEGSARLRPIKACNAKNLELCGDGDATAAPWRGINEMIRASPAGWSGVHCNGAGAGWRRRSAGCTFSTLTPTFLETNPFSLLTAPHLSTFFAYQHTLTRKIKSTSKCADVLCFGTLRTQNKQIHIFSRKYDQDFSTLMEFHRFQLIENTMQLSV